MTLPTQGTKSGKPAFTAVPDFAPQVYFVFRKSSNGHLYLYATYWDRPLADAEAKGIKGVVSTSPILADYSR